MTNWVNDYLARVSYVDGGRGPDQYDCWGLVREARNLHQGQSLLPEFGALRNTDPKSFTMAYRNQSSLMEACAPEDGAIAAVMIGKVCVHVALVVETPDGLYILEINPVRGARFLRLSLWQRDHLCVTFHRDSR